MKCHYDVLGLPRDAEDADIKKAYRKLALQWHPDKNLNDQETAREQFQLIQQAYEVLSDSHERAWYDNHRDQILRGRDSDYEDNCLDVFQYFTVTCFKGYGDDPGGFYAVYSEIFKKIAAEDAEFMEDEEEIEDIPIFGDSKSSYESVVGPFYAYWNSYCTKRTYSWLCKYNITEIKDRRILREIEKETKKLAQKAKRERNEEVRNLVSFVKRRDKRVDAHRKQLEEKAELNRKKQEQNRLEQIRKRNKEVEEMKKSHAINDFKPEGYEEQLRLLEQEYGGSSEEYTDDEEEYNEVNLSDINEEIVSSDENDLQEDNFDDIEVDDLYCVACDKSFKNKKAVTNHQTSKKHLDNVEKLKVEMLEDEKRINGESSPTNPESLPDENITAAAAEEGASKDETKDEKTKLTKKERKNIKAQKTAKNASAVLSTEPEELPDLLAELRVEKENWHEEKKSNKKAKNKKVLAKRNNETAAESTSKIANNECSSKTDEDDLESKVMDKKKTEKTDINDIDVSHVCVTCKTVFSSKNKLFSHLKQTSHGVYIAKEKDAGSSSGANNKKKKRK